MSKLALILYTNLTADSLLAAAQHYTYCQANGYTPTLKNLAAIATGDIDTYLSTLTAATYDKIFVDCPCDGPVGTATISTAQQYTLRTLLKVASQGTLSTVITNPDTHTSTTIGLTGQGWTVNSLTGALIYISAGTGAGQIATIKSNTATVATIWGSAFATTPDGSTTAVYTITGCALYMCGTAHTTTAYKAIASITELAWTAVYPNNSIPLIGSFLGGEPGYALYAGTASAIGASTLTDSAASSNWTSNCYAGMYVQIYSASTNSYQYALIASNTTTVLTLTLIDTTHYWSRLLVPTGTPAYKIVNQPADVFNDEYSKVYIMTYLTNLTNSGVLATYKDIIDSNYSLPTLSSKMSPTQNIKYVQGTILPMGKVIFDSLVAGAAL